MAPIRVGFVGLSTSGGWASTATAPALLDSGKYVITAVSTSRPDTAKATAAQESHRQESKVGVTAYSGDTSAIAQDQDVDLVAVSISASQHFAAALPVLEAGKDIFIEWPAGISVEETRKLASLAKAQGVRSVVGLQARHSPVIAKAKEALESGKIGKVLSTSIISLAPKELAYWGQTVREAYPFTTDPTRSASLLDMAIAHQLAAFIYLLGNFHHVSSTLAIQYPTATLVDSDIQPVGKEVPNRTADHVAFSGILKDSGALANVVWRAGEPSTNGRKQFLWIIDGEEGSITLQSDEVSGSMIQMLDPDLYVNGELVEVEKGNFLSDYVSLWNEYAQGSDGMHATLDDALELKRLIHAVHLSAQEGRRVDV